MNELESSIARWRLVAFIVLALSLAATVVLWQTTRSLDRRALERDFAGQTTLATARIESRMAGYALVLRSGNALIGSSNSVTRDEWRKFVAALDLDTAYPGVLGLGFAERIRPEDRAAHVARVRAEGFPGYDIWPSGERTEYSAIVFLEPFNQRNREAFGFDMLSEKTRRAAMEQARDSGRPVLSGKVQLVQEITKDKQPGFLLYLPVYAKGSNPANPAARRAALIGYVYCAFRAHDLMHGVLDDVFNQLSVEVFDGESEAEGSKLYDGRNDGYAVAGSADDALHHTSHIVIAGRPWTLVFRPTERFYQANPQTPTIAGLAGGTIISLLLFLLIWNLVDTRQRALALLHRAEREREISEARFRNLFEHGQDALVMVEHDGRIANVNAAAEECFGYRHEELVGQKIELLVPGSTAAAHVGLRNNYVEDPERRPMEARRRNIRGLRKDGSEFPAEVSLTPIISGSEMIIAATVRDLTERISTETQLRQMQKMQAIGNLTGGLAHDLNNLLSVIIGNLDLLAERAQLDPASKQLEQAALGAALRGSTLVQRLLAFARRQPLEPEPCNVNLLVEGMSGIFERSLGDNIAIELNLDEDIQPVVVDPAQLEAALLNIANNARDAMPTGGRLIIATRNCVLDDDYVAQHSDVVPGNFVLIEVSDTGSGMPADIIEQIFEPFFTTKPSGEGTGLGLSMVFGFAKQSGGHINVYSEPGVGSTFRLYLPANANAVVAAGVQARIAAEGGQETILVVEDKAALRKLVLLQLGELGYRVLEAADGTEAIRILETEPVDLMFSDIVMPGGLSGYDLARILQERWPETKILMTSGFPDLKLYGNGDHPANLRLLRKPYRKADLAEALREVLDFDG